MSENTAYFGDGDTLVGFDGEPSVVVAYRNPLITRSPENSLDAVHWGRGGDVLSVKVSGGVKRHNRGDAEWYVYSKLQVLGVSGPGELYVSELVWPGAFFVGGTASIWPPGPSGCWVQYEYRFEVTAPESETNYGPSFSAPAPPGEYEGRNNTGEFVFKGETMGERPGRLAPRVSRRVAIIPIPRCRGVRLKDIEYGRVMSLELSVVARESTRAELEDALRDMAVGAGVTAGTLTGNGNTYEDCYLTGWSGSGYDGRFEHLLLRFVQELQEEA